ncbi:hypothetical protein VTO42DRAFT_8602 [Malbranchea cinnamomea]
MFGSQQQQGQPAKRGLFDVNTPTTQSTSQSSPFAQTSGAQTGFSLAGGSQQQQQPQQASIFSPNPPSFGFGTASSSAARSQPSFGLFGQTQQQQQQQPPQQPQHIQGGLQTGQPLRTDPVAPPSTQSAFFSTLLERAKKRPQGQAAKGPTGDVPSLELGLGDIRRAARGLGGGGDQDGSRPLVPDSRAHHAIAASGVSPTQVLQDLKAFDAQTAAARATPPQEEPFDPDNQKYLRRIQQRGREAMITESLARVRKDFDAFLEETVNIDWEEQRQRICEHFGLAAKDDKKAASAFGQPTIGSKPAEGFGSCGRRSVFGRSGLGKSVIGSPSAGPGSSKLFSKSVSGDVAIDAGDARFAREKIGHFATKVQQLNEARLQKQAFPLLHEFAEIERLAASEVPRQLPEAYEALISITGESPNVLSLSTPGAIRERYFAEAYSNESFTSREAMEMRDRIVQGARKYLEQAFYKEMEQLISKNPREAQLGGVPTIINKIRAYIRLRAARKDLAPEGTELQMMGQDYCWILIFYLLRCGFVDEAAEYVSQDPGFRSMDYKFVTYMRAYAASRRLPRDLQQKINGEYQQRLRNAPENTVDPYRMACYKIIGRCDLGQRRIDGIGQGVEDWMWLQFVLAREDNRAEEVAGEVFALQDIQNDIREIGQRIFTKGQDAPGNYGTFFLLQIIAGMFEQAVSYLAQFAPISAVHFAIALDYYGLLRVSDFYTSGDEILSYTTRELPQINFAQLITQYTQEFRTGYVEAAVDYFTLICLNADLPGDIGRSHASVCHEALREFILETRDFAKLLGDIRSDGSRIKGVIEKRLELIKFIDQKEFLKTITVQAAAVADDKGLITDAVLLYHLAEDYDKVIQILNRTLSDAVAVDLGANALRLQPLKPRISQQEQQEEGAPGVEPGSSLSLITVDDPVMLAKNMISLYNSNALYYQKIHQANRESCGLLLRMMEAKQTIEEGRWAEGLDLINTLQILPLDSHGSVSHIRSAAQAFSTLPPVISRNAGHLIMWSVTCVARERERLAAGLYENDMRVNMAERLLVTAKDLMVFAGMIKYKLPPRVYETLARVAGEMGVL